MTVDRRTHRVLYRDSNLRVVAEIVSLGDEPRLSIKGIQIEASHRNSTGEHAWINIDMLPEDRVRNLLVEVVRRNVLNWDRGECPWEDWTAAGAKP